VLTKAKNEEVIANSDYNYFFVCSNLALQYFDVQKFKSAIKTLSRIILHQSFLNFNSSFRIKIIQKLIYTQRIKQDQELVDDIMLLLSKIPVEQAENDDVVNYNRWLLKKLA
jgi:hypothetical protein